MHDYGRSTGLLHIPGIYLYSRTLLALQALIIVQTIIYHHGKDFTTDQIRVNPEHTVIKCVGS